MDTTTDDQPGRCGSCGARLAPGVPWCTLCFTVQSPAAVDGEPLPGGTDTGDDPDPGADHADGDPDDDRHDVVRVAAVDQRDVEAEADRLLAELAAHRPQRAGVAQLTDGLSSPGVRVAVMVGGVALVCLLLLGVLAVGGALL